MPTRRTLLLAALALCQPSAWSALDYSDHPLLSAVAGYSVRSKAVKEFDLVSLEDKYVFETKERPYTGPRTFEGKVTALTYRNPAGSAVAVYRNHVAAIQKLGGQALTPAATSSVSRWHVFRIDRPGLGPVSVLLNIPYDSEYYLTLIEHKAMVQSVQAGELAREIAASGYATLYIHFDTAQAVLKEDGQAAVKEIVALMRQQPGLNLSIEGHTDNVGQAAANQKLSQARSEAVMKAIVAAGIPAARLKAVGRGQEVPIADNRQEAGRAKNRRVELVKIS